ncbi:hypothetical protein B0H65DRAFT_443966 [Neurospora tetraspora]|uniref:Uncharacterized protein n=1 Tax=Neurospora tetraspora TaxID=94610 RepID=A0AAE0JDK2_9PEZI|nr:hypothetical protein B0H65DRAFT_443966 [Neurospora tetraspora]
MAGPQPFKQPIDTPQNYHHSQTCETMGSRNAHCHSELSIVMSGLCYPREAFPTTITSAQRQFFGHPPLWGEILKTHLLTFCHEGHGCSIKPPAVLAPSRPVPAPRRAKAAGSPTSALSNLRDKYSGSSSQLLVLNISRSPAHHSKPCGIFFPEDRVYTSISSQCVLLVPRIVLPQSPPQLPANHHLMCSTPANETTTAFLAPMKPSVAGPR